MRYALLIYTSEALDAQATEEQNRSISADYFAFGERYKDKLLGGEALMPTSSATTVRAPEGKALTTDGPFAETKEQLGGFYLVNAANLDEAIEIAAHIPGAATGSIEVRPIMEFNN
ncbi:MAG TPA: YciI family protein [Ktedonobacterales bacterium]|nr:YciI family protein [Ktedonobacterales bacterium]